MIEFFLILILLQIKHWYIDFVDQSMEEVHSKGLYGKWLGIRHSLKHGLGTTACIVVILGPIYLTYAIFMGILDGIVHYHVDWAKMNWGNRDIQNPLFWNHLGLDQMIHQLTYILIIGLIVL